MKTVRRLYFYAVSLVALEVMIQGGVQLLRLTKNRIPYNEAMASALATVIVSALVFYIHWRNIQKDDHNTIIRAVFFYLTLAVLLIPCIQAVFSFIGKQEGDLWVLPLNLIAAVYIYQTLHDDWQTDAAESLRITRPWALYLWMIYGLALFIQGIYGLLGYLSDIIFDYYSGAPIRKDVTALFLGAIVLGVVIWKLWLINQDDENGSTHIMRQIVFYALDIGAFLLMFGIVIAWMQDAIHVLFPETEVSLLADTLHDTLPALLSGVIVWGYYHLAIQSDARTAPQRTLTARSIRRYILLSVGLISLIVGGLQTIGLATDLIDNPFDAGRFSSALSFIIVGGALWGFLWRQKNPPERANAQRVYLYLFIFIGTLGVMVSAVEMLQHIFLWGLVGEHFSKHLVDFLAAILDGLMFAWILQYHVRILQQALKKYQKRYQDKVQDMHTLIMAQNAEKISQILQDEFPAIPLQTVQQPNAKTRIVIIEADLPETDALCILLPPDDNRKWILAGETRQEALKKLPALLRAAADNETPGNPSLWRIAGIIALTLFILWLFTILLSIVL